MATFDTLGAIPRTLTALTIPAGLGGVSRMQAVLPAALDGSGPAIAPLPEGPPALVASFLEAIKPDSREFPLESNDIALVMATSGSTGAPRGVLLSGQALHASASAFANRFGTDARWVVSMPMHRIAGIMVLVRAHLYGNPFEVDPSTGGARPFSAPTFAATTLKAKRQSNADGRPLMVSLVPTQIARLLEAGSVGIEALQSYEVVLSGAAATPQPLLDQLRSHGVNVVVSYGMSETCGGCAYDGLPLDGVSISLGTQDDVEPGRISISGPVLASGYRLRPDVDALTFIDGRLMTHDVGKLDSSGLLHVLGRLDDIVIVGGVNVALSAVEAAIRHHPLIEDVAVIDISDPLWGSLPLAYVVLRSQDTDTDALTAQIKDVVAQRIGKAATPRNVHYVEQLPMLDSGKIDRLSLRLQAAQDIAQGRVRHPGTAE